MKILKNIGMAAISMTLMLTTLTSCKDSGFLDINYNPNYPSSASDKYLVAAAEASTVAVMGYQAAITGNMWCQYTTQGNTTNQYNTVCTYATTTASTYPPVAPLWQNGYANALEDLKLAMADAESKGEWNWWLMAKVLTAYNFMMLTDSYGDIPFLSPTRSSTTARPWFILVSSPFSTRLSLRRARLWLLMPRALYQTMTASLVVT